MTTRPSKRQEAKDRNKKLKDLYYLLQWVDEDELFDTMPALQITPPEGSDLQNLQVGTICKAAFASELYEARVIAKGKYREMKLTQSQKEKEAEEKDQSDTQHTGTPVSRMDHVELQSSVEGNKEKRKTPGKCSTEKKSSSSRNGSTAKKKLKEGKLSSAKSSNESDELTPSKTGHRPRKLNETKEAPLESLDEADKVPYGKAVQQSSVHTPRKWSTPRKPSPSGKRKTPRKRPIVKQLSPYESSDDSDEDNMRPPSKQPRLQVGDIDLHQLEARRSANIAENEMLKRMIGLSPGIPPTTLTAEVTRLKEKIRNLEKSQIRLNSKFKEQQKELNRLVRISSIEVSSASETAPSVSPMDMPRRTFSREGSSLSTTPARELKAEKSPEFLSTINQVKLANAKLQKDPGIAALKLMDCVFTTAEMVNGNPSGVTKSKDPVRQRTIQPLSLEKMNYIDDVLQSIWNATTSDKLIRRKMTQKCTDMYNDPRYAHLRHT